MKTITKVGVYIDRDFAEQQWSYGLNVFSLYLYEIFDHFRIPFKKIESYQAINRDEFDLVLVGLAPETEEVIEQVWRYIEKGGTVLAFSNLNRIAKRLGYQKAKKIPHGYSSFLESKYSKLKVFDAIPWYSENETSSNVGTLSSGEPVFQSFQIGEGKLVRCSVDIAGTIVKLQQGAEPLFEDGTPAVDGTGATNDEVLKVDDQILLDWEEDRTTTETGQPYFPTPYADLWREVLLKKVIELSVSSEKTLPFVGYWPEGVEDVALLSHDSDYNEDEHAWTTLELLKEADIHSTWCMILPGYSQHVYEKVIEEGHELAFHYNAVEVDDGHWGRSEFKRQFEGLKKDIPQVNIVSNKNHLTRFEGWGELFEWCEENGIESDQTRGASKKGNLGFSCGTCQPYFPIAWSTEQNRFYDVLQIGFLTPDINTGKWADESIIEPLLDQVKAVKGVAHFLFHQIHLHRNENVRKAFRAFVREAKKRNFVFWTGKEINEWERFRRSVHIQEFKSDGTIDFTIGARSDKPIVIYEPLVKGSPEHQGDTVEIFGIRCTEHVYQAKDVKEHGLNI